VSYVGIPLSVFLRDRRLPRPARGAPASVFSVLSLCPYLSPVNG
jgi:hypothetical protein